jgi:hypothetical protein
MLDILELAATQHRPTSRVRKFILRIEAFFSSSGIECRTNALRSCSSLVILLPVDFSGSTGSRPECVRDLSSSTVQQNWCSISVAATAAGDGGLTIVLHFSEW